MAGQQFLSIVNGVKTVITSTQVGGGAYVGKLLSLNSSGFVDATAMPALTGAITTTAGTVATTLAAKAVALSNMADVATGTVFYRASAGTGAPEVTAIGTLATDMGLTTSANVAGNLTSDSKWASIKGMVDYVGTMVAGLLDLRGNFSASGNAWPTSAAGGSGVAGAILKGDSWLISVAGTLGAFAVTAGDMIYAKVDTPGSTDANWAIIQNNLTYTPEDAANKVTSISGSSTDVQYPSAKLVYDQLAGKVTKDANNNASANNFLEGYTNQDANNGSHLGKTITLTVASSYYQAFYDSGTGGAMTTGMTLIMPVANTLVAGQSWEVFNNTPQALTVQSSGLNQIGYTVPSWTKAIVNCVLASGTTAASWNLYFTGQTAVTGTGAGVLATGATINGGAIVNGVTLAALTDGFSAAGGTTPRTLTVNTGAVTLTGNSGGSTLTLGSGASSVSGSNTGDNAQNTSIAATLLDALAVAGTTNTDRDANTTNHGLLLKAVAPASTMINVVGIGNGATVYSLKALYDATTPSNAGTAAAGTALTAARIDHVHNAQTTVSGNAGSVTNATFTTALTVNTGTLTLTAAAANSSVLTIGAGAVSVSGTNTGDTTAVTSANFVANVASDTLYPSVKATNDAIVTAVGAITGAPTKTMVTSENLVAGDFVNIYSNGGVLTARKANATDNTKPCDGFVKAASTSPANCTVYFSGLNPNVSGLTIGVYYVLSTTGGALLALASAPATAGNIYQPIGKATATTEIVVYIEEPIIYA